MVAFSSASAAVQCAVAMQQLFERRYRDAEQALHVRIGLAAGESTVKDGDYFGAPSIEAARLCAEAPADGILISGMGKALAGRCEGVEFSSVGELELKGFPDPVEAFSVSWEPLAQEVGEPAGRWPLPALLRSVPPVKYVGRVEERAALEEAMKLARARQRQVVLVERRAGDRQDAARQLCRPQRPRRGIRRRMGRMHRGARGALRALDRGLLAARGARARGADRRRTSSVTAESSHALLATSTHAATRFRRRSPLTRRPSATCCSRPSPVYWQKSPGASRCVWCSMTCTGLTRSRWRS